MIDWLFSALTHFCSGSDEDDDDADDDGVESDNESETDIEALKKQLADATSRLKERESQIKTLQEKLKGMVVS